LFLYKAMIPSRPTMTMMRTSLVVIVLMLAVFVGSLWRSPTPLSSSSQTEVSQPGLTTIGTGEVAQVICKPGYLPPLCLAKEFDKSEDLTFPGNGAARPAVAKDTLPGYSGVHKPAYVNDGLYGPGASWISNSPYSWIKIDMGKVTTINTVAFGRDRLGNFNDRDPGQFVIAVALSDNVYADGNSSNDYMEYTEVYNSDQAGFNGVVSGSETIWASFSPVRARYVKITFENAGTAVDEIEVYMVRPPAVTVPPTKKPKDDQPGVASTSIPANTPVPTSSAIPKSTSTPVPTDPPPPTNTAIPPPTDPPPTNPPPTDPPPPTDSPPTDAQLPPPPDTVEPIVELFETPVPAGEP